MASYELTNNQRKHFGLSLVNENWDKQALSETVILYFDRDNIVKILNYSWGYVEYDTDIVTRNRQILMPKTAWGQEKLLTISRLLKIKGSGIQFSGSFSGGGIHVYDNKRNLFFIKGYAEEGIINSYADINNWVLNYIANVPDNYFDWLNKELSQKRLNIQTKAGDIIAFKVANNTYGFARVLLDVFNEKPAGPAFSLIYTRSLIIMVYAYYANTVKIDIENLLTQKTLPSIFIFDIDVYRGEMPIIGYRALTEKDKRIPLPQTKAIFVKIPYTKTDIDTFIASNN